MSTDRYPRTEAAIMMASKLQMAEDALSARQVELERAQRAVDAAKIHLQNMRDIKAQVES